MPCWFYEQRAETLKCDEFKNYVIPGNFPQRTFQQVRQAGWVGFPSFTFWSWDDVSVCPGVGWSLVQWGFQICSVGYWPSTSNSMGLGCWTHHPETWSCQKDILQCNAVTGCWGFLSLLLKPEEWQYCTAGAKKCHKTNADLTHGWGSCNCWGWKLLCHVLMGSRRMDLSDLLTRVGESIQLLLLNPMEN